MALQSVPSTDTREGDGFDAFQVELDLMDARALADLIGSAAVSEAQPKEDSIPAATELLVRILDKIKAAVLPTHSEAES